MPGIERLAVDASVVKMSMADADWNTTFVTECQVRLLDLGIERPLCSGSVAHADWIASEPAFGPVVFQDEFSFQEGGLLVGSRPLPESPDGARYMYRDASGKSQLSDRWLAAWYGKRYTVHTQSEGGPDRADEMISLFERFILTERPEGLVVTPRDEAQVTIVSVGLRQQIPGKMLFSVQPLSEAAIHRLPKWEGTPVDGGELFYASHTSEEEPHDISEDYLVLVSASAVTYGIPLVDATEDFMTHVMSTMTVEWESAA